MSNAELRKDIIAAGRIAVKELVKVAKEPIVTTNLDDALAVDKLKIAAQAKRVAIEDAFAILSRIEEEENIINTPEDEKNSNLNSSVGFAERNSKKK